MIQLVKLAQDHWDKISYCTFGYFRINASDIKLIERRLDDSMSSLSSSNYMIELIVYIVVEV